MPDGSELSEISLTEHSQQPSYAIPAEYPPQHAPHFIPPSGPQDPDTPRLTPAMGEVIPAAVDPWPGVYPCTTAAASMIYTPVQSARGTKRRVMSSSTYSSDLQSDIMSIIRCSPTDISLFAGVCLFLIFLCTPISYFLHRIKKPVAHGQWRSASLSRSGWPCYEPPL